MGRVAREALQFVSDYKLFTDWAKENAPYYPNYIVENNRLCTNVRVKGRGDKWYKVLCVEAIYLEGTGSDKEKELEAYIYLTQKAYNVMHLHIPCEMDVLDECQTNEFQRMERLLKPLKQKQ